MPVNTEYKGYDAMLAKVTKVRDFAAGSEAVKAKRTVYLPELTGQTKDQYNAYLLRGYLVPATEPTAMIISGAITRKPSVFEPKAKLEYLLDDIDGNNLSSNQFVSNMITELLYAGAVGYLVEFSDKPIVKKYTRESIINIVGDSIVLMQSYSVQDGKDPFEQEIKTEYLELTIENGIYIQNIWREEKTGWAIHDTKTPTNRGAPLTKIPFVICSANDKGLIKSDPLLLHLVNSNHDQYLMSTDHRHGLHWTALPTLFLFGDFKDENGVKKQIKIGAGSANQIDDTEAKAQLLEFTGAGLGSLKAAIDSTIEIMASIGAKMMMNGGGGVKSAETSRIDASSETATLSIIANSVDQTMERLLKIIAEWQGAEQPEFSANRDFIDVKLDPNALMALLKTWQSGGMSLDTFLYNLQKGELLPKDITPKQEADRIETTGNDFTGGLE
jgi:hypothetical protein